MNTVQTHAIEVNQLVPGNKLVLDIRSPQQATTWSLVDNITDRWGELNEHQPELKCHDELIANPLLLERLRDQMWGELTFLARKDGKWGILFEIEFMSTESDGPSDTLDLRPYDEVTEILTRCAGDIASRYPEVSFAIPDAAYIHRGRPALWAYFDDCALTVMDIEALGSELSGL